MGALDERVRNEVDRVFSYWYADDRPEHEVSVKSIQSVVPPLYVVDLHWQIWQGFSLRALYVDGDTPMLFLDAMTLSHLVEACMLQHYSLHKLNIGALAQGGYMHRS